MHNPFFSRRYRLLVVSLPLAICGPLFAGTAHAQSGDILKILQKQQSAAAERGATALAVSPPMLRLRAPPGGVAEGKIHVSNDSNYDAMISLFMGESRVVHGGKVEQITDPAFFSADSMAKNIQLIPSNPSLASGTGKEVIVRIRVTPGMKGTLYGVISVGLDLIRPEAKSSTKEERGKYIMESGIGIAAAQGVIVTLDVEGPGGPPSYTVGKPIVTLPTRSDLLRGAVSVTNPSDHEMALAASAVVFNATNDLVARLKPEAKLSLRPGGTVRLRTSPSAVVLPPGTYKMVFTIAGERVKTETVTETFSVGR